MKRLLLYIISVLSFTAANVTTVSAAETADSVFVRLMRTEGMTFSHDNDVTPLPTGEKKFEDMFKAIRQAKHSIHMLYFNFRNDSIANLLFDVLEEKAKEGVQVRCIYDAFGNNSNNKPIKEEQRIQLRKRGINIHVFDQITFPWVNHIYGREHRKIVVIDGQIAYTGGMNIADYYITGTEQVGEWRDMHCRLEGSEVNTLQKYFLGTWYKITKEMILDKQYFNGGTNPPNDQRINPKHAFTGLRHNDVPTAHNMMVGTANREPHSSPKAVRVMYINAINSAKDTIRIINPYFTLVPSVRKALKNALRRGVVIQLMLSERCDEPVTPDLGYYNAYKLAKMGCQVWIYRNGFHHTKTMTVDDCLCTIGSTNLDARSLTVDNETNLAIVNKDVTRQLIGFFEVDKAKSFRMTPEVYKTWRTKWQRSRVYFYLMLMPLL